MAVKRIKIRYSEHGMGYRVSEPSWDGGEVVLAADYDDQARMLEDARKALRDIKAWFMTLEESCADDDPLKAIRQRVHEPVHARIDAILARVPGESAQLDEESLRSKP